MFGRKRRRPHWDMLPPDENYQSPYSDEQRRFMLRELANNPTEKTRVKERMVADIEAARRAGRNAYADIALSLSMSLNGWNAKRIAQDLAYWEEYQRVMLGERVDRVQYLLGRRVPIKRKE